MLGTTAGLPRKKLCINFDSVKIQQTVLTSRCNRTRTTAQPRSNSSPSLVPLSCSSIEIEGDTSNFMQPQASENDVQSKEDFTSGEKV